ncbi:MAG: right-handed parallel beta-helix repeat-containing protein, partial [Mycobacterium sp.]|nr:right-handed parallel beta-helix repeat-containing protein [Mycobacterium sp.]
KRLKKLSHWGSRRPYFLENKRAFLDSPGEWFLDTDTGTVYLWPPAGIDMAHAKVIAPVLEHLIRFEGVAGQPVRHLAFTGLTFKHTTWALGAEGYDGHQADVVIGGAIDGNHVDSVTFRDCLFAEHGRYALRLEDGCRNVEVDACEFRDIGGGAILLGSYRKGNPAEVDQTFGYRIIDCHVHDNGKVYPSSVGIGVGYSNHNVVAGNHVHHTTYTGISVGFGWTYNKTAAHDNLIENNHLHDIQLVLGDGAAIYTLSRQPGTVIRGNVIHDVFGYYTYGSGICLDNNSSDMLVENNFVARTIGASFVNNAVGRDNVIRNNIFALAATDVFHINRCKNNTIVGNIIYISEGECAPPSWLRDGVKEMDRNLCWFVGGEEFVFPGGLTLEEWRETGLGQHSIVADPLFTDVANGDFSLRPQSPALKQIDFKPFEVPVIGPASPDRRQDPRLVQLFKLSRSLRNKRATVQVI